MGYDPKVCPLCKSINLSKKPRFFQAYPQEDGLALRNGYYHCHDCKCFFVLPLPKANQIIKHWRFVSYSDPQNEYIYKYLKHKLGEKILKRIHKLTKGKRLLDYGCGFGNFMGQAKEYGFDPVGLDASSQAIKSVKHKDFAAYLVW